MRAAQTALLPDTCTISRCSNSPNGMGGQTQTWKDEHKNVACRLAPSTASEAQEALAAARLTSKQGWTVTLPFDTDVTAKDRIVVGTRTLEVIGVLSRGSWTTALRVLAVEVS